MLGHEMAHHHLDHHAEGISLILVHTYSPPLITHKTPLFPVAVSSLKFAVQILCPVPIFLVHSVAEPLLLWPPHLGDPQAQEVSHTHLVPNPNPNPYPNHNPHSCNCSQLDDPCLWLDGGQVPRQQSKVLLFLTSYHYQRVQGWMGYFVKT